MRPAPPHPPASDGGGYAGAWMAPEMLSAHLAAAQSGGIAELDALLRAIRPALHSFFARHVDPASADDLAQSVLWTVAREYTTIVAARAASWLVTVARNALRDEFRRATLAAARFAPAAAASQQPTRERVHADTEYGELRQAVMAAAHSLCGPAVRDAITGALDGLTVRDMADLSGVSPHAIRMRLLRARAALAPIVLPLLR
jgi:RNA polymerase sigma-70 factor, ECF subfamily